MYILHHYLEDKKWSKLGTSVKSPKSMDTLDKTQDTPSLTISLKEWPAPEAVWLNFWFTKNKL